MTSICRLCLCKLGTAHSLLEKPYHDMLEALTSIQVNPDDSATVCCTTCLCDLTQAFNIQQRILRADEKFHNETGSVEIHDENGEKDVNEEQANEEPLEPAVIQKHKKCPICAWFIEESVLMEHTKTHFACSQYCDLCQETFDNMKLYRAHWDDRHKNERNFNCTSCSVKFRYRCIYLLHTNLVHDAEAPADKDVENVLPNSSDTEMQIQTGQETAAISAEPETCIQCDICRKKFPTKFHLSTHRQVHKPKKTCPICNAEITRSNFKKHVENHETAGPRICELCGSVLRSQESLRGHMSSVHSKFRKDCEICGQTFTHRYRYSLHVKRHKGEKSQVCELCGKAFLTVFYLNCHMKNIHLKLKPHICSYCQKAFQSKFGLRTHVRQHTNETPYRCEVCGEGFRQNVSLKSHRKSKHNIEEEKNCKCDICGKEFGSEHAVASHKRLH